MYSRQSQFVLLLLIFMFAGVGIHATATGSPPSLAALEVAGRALDDGLHERVETLLRTDVGLTGARFRISSDQAVITIAGTVPDEHALHRALELAGSVKGVREVRNAMEVDDPK